MRKPILPGIKESSSFEQPSVFGLLVSTARTNNLRAKIAMEKAEKKTAGAKKRVESASKFKDKMVSFKAIEKDLKNDKEFYTKYKLNREQREKYNQFLQDR